MDTLKIIKLQEGVFKHIVNNSAIEEVFYNTNTSKLSIDYGTISINSGNFNRDFYLANIEIYDIDATIPIEVSDMDDFVMELVNLGYPLVIPLSSNSNPGGQSVSSASANTKGIVKLTEDFGGTSDNPKVVGIQGVPVSSETPNVGDIFRFDGTRYVPTAIADLVPLKTEEFTSVANQTSFQLMYAPIGTPSITINGIRVSKNAVTVNNRQLVYVPSGNDNYNLENNDFIIIDYKY